LASLVAVAATGRGADVTEVYLGSAVEGVSGSSGMSKSYKIYVRKDMLHYIHLSSPNGNIIGLWSLDETAFLIEGDPQVPTRTVRHTFPRTGRQTVYLKSLDDGTPSEYTFKIWVP